MFLCVFQVVLFFFPFISSIYFLCGWFVSWPLCFSDEGRSAVDLAGGAQIVAELIKSLYQNTEPENEKLLTVLCGMLMNYSNDNGNDPPPLPEIINHSPRIGEGFLVSVHRQFMLFCLGSVLVLIFNHAVGYFST